jgi:hypothetical protein
VVIVTRIHVALAKVLDQPAVRATFNSVLFMVRQAHHERPSANDRSP